VPSTTTNHHASNENSRAAGSHQSRFWAASLPATWTALGRSDSSGGPERLTRSINPAIVENGLTTDHTSPTTMLTTPMPMKNATNTTSGAGLLPPAGSPANAATRTATNRATPITWPMAAPTDAVRVAKGDHA